MLVALVVVPGIVARLAVDVAPRGRLRGAAPAARRRRGDAARRRRLAGAGRADSGGRPAVDLGHERQQHPVADLRIQRPRPRRRTGRRSRAGSAAAAACSAAAPGRCACSTRRSAARPAGCSASRSSAASASSCASRLRRGDPRSGWLIAVGGAFLTTAVLFSCGQRHLPPLLRLAAGAVHRRAGRRRRGSADRAAGCSARVIAPLAIAAGVATELAVLHDYPGPAELAAAGADRRCALLAALALALLRVKRLRADRAGVWRSAALLLAPAVWAVDTLGHATSGTFPEGGPGNVQTAGGIFGGPGGLRRTGGRAGRFGGFGPGASGASGAGAPPSVAAVGAPGGEGGQRGAAAGGRSGNRSRQ